MRGCGTTSRMREGGRREEDSVVHARGSKETLVHRREVE